MDLAERSDAPTTLNGYDKWDIRYIQFARHVASWSKDPSTKSGAIIVRPDRSVLSVGFNGFPQRMSDAAELYNDREKKYSRVVHCEINALIFAQGSLRGCTLYTVPFVCCDRCVVQMIQAGIDRFVFPELPEDKLERWGKSMGLAVEYIIEAGATPVCVSIADIPDIEINGQGVEVVEPEIAL